ncbi:TonB-dependent receptor [Pedobacter sp. HMWF019]|uniref:outer membrane beta-barrel family protein n=1 Tax=Pedobacter sp. HMWF019 TaxID=2056856 RepID=UPI000D3528C1|nr:outer membrane beta-barrel family protein [Pedobacter sp. HMWF019]PTS95114.1 TonB-dependent receptor [Pedobacter sp. HMWF019]
MHKNFKILFFLIFSMTIHAQAQSGRIKGIALDMKTRQGIEFATVVLLLANDSSIVKNVFTDSSGHFQLNEVTDGNYILLISSVEYLKKYHGPLLVNSARPVLDVGELLISVHQRVLNSIEVVGQVPLFRNKANGTVEVNVANTILSNSTSAIEILSRSPGVAVTDDGISVLGKGEAIIYLNGRRVTMEQLSAVSSSIIRSIEIIPNPSSKYDAEGKAVINVITVVRTADGYKGTLKQYLSVSDFTGPSRNTNLDLNYKKNKLSLTGSYGLLVGKGKEILNTTRSRLNTPDHFLSVLMTDWDRDYRNFSNYNLGGQYDLDEKSYISAAYTGAYNHLGGRTRSENAITSTSIDGLFRSDIANNNRVRNNSVTLNYGKNIDSLGSSLFVGGQYAGYGSNTDDGIKEDNLVEGQEQLRTLNNKSSYNIRLLTVQLDYTKIFHRHNKIELGAKLGYAANRSGTDFLIAQNGIDFEPDDRQSAWFKYRELIPAAYLNFNGLLGKKTTYGIGLRTEWSKYQLETDGETLQKMEDQYIDFFPSTFIAFKVSGQSEIRASYVSRISRPRYQALNPSGVYQDAYTRIEGNPFLQPERTNAVEIGASFKVYSVKLGYSQRKDPITWAALRGKTENDYVLKPLNLKQLNSWFLSLSVSLNKNWWTSSNTFNISYDKFGADDALFGLKEGRPQLSIYSSNTFNIGKVFRLQTLVRYTGGESDGLYYSKEQLLTAIGIEKDFFNKSLRLNLMANDLFRRDKPAGHYEIGQTYIEYARKNNNKYYRLSLTYAFGRLDKMTYSNKSTGQTENNRAQ